MKFNILPVSRRNFLNTRPGIFWTVNVNFVLVIILIGNVHNKVAGQPVERLFSGNAVLTIAHRGGIVPDIPENTMAAFREAMRLGADVIELDLRSTKDGHVVIMHDATLNRTTSGKGLTEEISYKELRKLDAGNGERVPSFNAVLKLIRRKDVRLLLDIKESRLLNKSEVVRLTQKYNLSSRVIAGCRNLEDLKAFQQLGPDMQTLGFIKSVGDLESFVEAGVDIIRVWPEWIREDPGLVNKAKSFGKPVWVTAGSASYDELKGLIESGVDGILTDFPGEMRRILTEKS